MNDDPMDERLIEGARDYNEPGGVPREEMWAKIAESRRGARSAERIADGGWRRSVWVSAAVAAALVLAVGIVIGRRLERAAPGQASALAVVPVLTPAPPDSAKPATPDRVATAAPKADSIIPKLRLETAKTGRRVQEFASAGDSSSNARGSANATPSLAYRLVMLQHLTGSEAMITAFRRSARQGEVDVQIAAWSRELLGTTRMLEASPVTQDPTMKRLLEDLDLVIVQITQYVARGTTNPDELDLIEQSINKRGVINKLRGNLPARNAPAGT